MEQRLSRRACPERVIHTQTRGVCVCQSKRENHPVPQEGGWEIEWPYIHKDMGGWVGVCVGVCVCVSKGNTILFHSGGGGGFSFLAGPHAQLENQKTAGVGEGMGGPPGATIYNPTC